MHNFKIDGNQVTGAYRCWCGCGKSWNGQALRFGLVHFDPALPIAECCLHWRESHADEPLNIQWTKLFSDWLVQYAHKVAAVFARDLERTP